MTRKLRYLFVLLFLTMTGRALAQTGSISGTVYDEKKEPIIGAIVQVFEAGATKGGAATDIDGNYVVKPLNPSGNYEVHVKYAGYKEIVLKGVLVSPDKITKLNFNMQINAKELEEVVVREYKVPLIEADKPGSTTTFTREQIQKIPTRNTGDIASLAAGTYQSKNGGNVSIAGARTGGTQYIIDGVMVQGSTATNLPPGSIDQMSVITSGIPAKYGDASGGIISITTRGGAPRHSGEVGAEHSLDGYGHNMAYFSVAGPLLRKKVDSVNKKNVLGYSLSGTYQFDKDNDPNYFDNYQVKADKLREIQQNPLVQTTDISGRKTYSSATEYITMKDLETRKTRVNADYKSARVVGKVDYQVSDNIELVAGGNYTYINQSQWDQRYSLFNPDAMPKSITTNGRGYIRLSQSFGKKNLTADAEDKKAPLISNAFYTLQADYENTHNNVEDPKLKHNPFLYGYVGKFVTNDKTLYGIGLDSAINRVGTVLFAYNAPTSVDFTPADYNPLLANYTKQYYSLAGADAYPTTLNDILANRGLINGYLPPYVYTDYTGSPIYFNSGFGRSGYSYSDQEQFAFNVDASFDLQPKKTRHAIEFGLYYQQRAERSYGIAAAGINNNLWALMRQLANRHITDLNTADPIYVIGGQRYTLDEYRNGNLQFGPNDTVIYNRLYNEDAQSTFDYNLRKKLNLDPEGTDYLYVDSYDPSLFSLDMFAPDELINGGTPLASWYGYDYTGKRVNGQVNFNDFFTKKDANGNYTREIGAFRPNYIAGFLQDKFELPNNVLFNVGVRVERFDANTKVLRDPYSLYAVHTVADNKDAVNNFNNQKTPDNIGGDYVVYVKDNQVENPEIIGYRNGDDWYDATGKFLQDPSYLNTLYGSDPQPYLVKSQGQQNRTLRMNEEGYDPNTSFTDYKPQVNVMPRINFSFPIAEQSLFYAHYDVYVMRPKTAGEIYVSPIDYLYLSQNGTQIIANPNLKPERVFDYELGFQQTLSQNSALTISGTYKERKDMIQIRPYLYAYPTTYYTFGNRDFSTTKGFSLKYDLRRVNHLQMQLSYTLQFAEGTGSSSTSGNGGSSTSVSSSGLLQYLIGAQLPNLRFALPLNVDSRHTINANLDYRYEKGEGPLVGNSHPLENAGINLVFRARSGEPYTRYAIPGQKIVVGGAYGSRLPWHYMLDLRIDKTFALFTRKSDDGIRGRTGVGLQAFLYIQNLLNTKDVLGVYGYTGRPDNDGFIASPKGQSEASTKSDPQSYSDLYNLSLLDQSLLNNPRRINLGISLNF